MLKENPKSIKITMLGDQASGKTCYILGIYANIALGNHGLTVHCIDDEENHELSKLCQNLVERNDNVRFPPATSTTKIYRFRCKNELTRIVADFEWIDYRGSALSDEPSKEDVKELNHYLQSSQCLFLCISGELLAKKVAQNDFVELSFKTKAHQMQRILGQIRTIHQPNTSLYPIIITISKYDYCYKKRSSENIVKDITTIFHPLFVQGSPWIVLICPITLGAELAENPSGGKIYPVNCDIPIFFALYCNLLTKTAVEAKQIKSLWLKLKSMERMPWYRIPLFSYHKKLNLLKQDLYKIKRSYDLNFKHLNALASCLQEVQQTAPIYKEGKVAQLQLSDSPLENHPIHDWFSENHNSFI